MTYMHSDCHRGDACGIMHAGITCTPRVVPSSLKAKRYLEPAKPDLLQVVRCPTPMTAPCRNTWAVHAVSQKQCPPPDSFPEDRCLLAAARPPRQRIHDSRQRVQPSRTGWTINLDNQVGYALLGAAEHAGGPQQLQRLGGPAGERVRPHLPFRPVRHPQRLALSPASHRLFIPRHQLMASWEFPINSVTKSCCSCCAGVSLPACHVR